METESGIPTVYSLYYMASEVIQRVSIEEEIRGQGLDPMKNHEMDQETDVHFFIRNRPQPTNGRYFFGSSPKRVGDYGSCKVDPIVKTTEGEK